MTDDAKERRSLWERAVERLREQGYNVDAIALTASANITEWKDCGAPFPTEELSERDA